MEKKNVVSFRKEGGDPPKTYIEIKIISQL